MTSNQHGPYAVSYTHLDVYKRQVKNLIRYQQSIAADSHIAFWNMYEAMGGDVYKRQR